MGTSSPPTFWILGVLVILGVMLTPIIGILIVGVMLKAFPNLTQRPNSTLFQPRDTRTDCGSSKQDSHVSSSIDLCPNHLLETDHDGATGMHQDSPYFTGRDNYSDLLSQSYFSHTSGDSSFSSHSSSSHDSSSSSSSSSSD